jgi:hypothetical protein
VPNVGLFNCAENPETSVAFPGMIFELLAPGLYSNQHGVEPEEQLLLAITALRFYRQLEIRGTDAGTE